ncbi:MAG: hypothetical protein WCO33_02285 [bacterium]
MPNANKLNLNVSEKRPPILAIVLVLVIVGLSATSFYFYKQYTTIKDNPQVLGQQASDTLLKSLGKLMVLPTDETPTIAEVLDKEKLKDQAFFSDSQNGDKIIIYTKAQKAIIFREKDNLIVNVGPILINNTSQVSVVLQGTKEAMAAVATTIASELGTSVNVTNKIEAKNPTTLKKNLVVDIKGTKSDAASRIATTIGGETGSLPAGVTAPADVDFLILSK